jgi:hypothetical protein
VHNRLPKTTNESYRFSLFHRKWPKPDGFHGQQDGSCEDNWRNKRLFNFRVEAEPPEAGAEPRGQGDAGV